MIHIAMNKIPKGITLNGLTILIDGKRAGYGCSMYIMKKKEKYDESESPYETIATFQLDVKHMKFLITTLKYCLTSTLKDYVRKI